MGAIVRRPPGQQIVELRGRGGGALAPEVVGALRAGLVGEVRRQGGGFDADVRRILDLARWLEIELEAAGDSIGAGLSELIVIAGAKLSTHLGTSVAAR